MKCSKHRLTLISLLVFWIRGLNGHYICNDTYNWNNDYGYPCDDYEFNVSGAGWCHNGTYTSSTLWTGGNTYKYPEFNCCGCGKGWPLWFVPASGYTAIQAVPEPSINVTTNSTSSILICNDTYRNLTICSMKCKPLPNNLPVVSITAINTQDFNVSTCTLELNMVNDSLQYILQIPVDNYLIFFANWSDTKYNLSCRNNTGIISSPMFCRYEVDAYPFISPQCLSENITNRYIPSGCVDAENWVNTAGYTCFEYEVIQLWCANGEFTQWSSKTGGLRYDYPERHCCACGKGYLSPFQLTSPTATNNSINTSAIGIMHLQDCSASPNNSHIFDLKCLGSLNFITTNITMNTTLYNCPLDCSFDWNTTEINIKQSVNVSRRSVGSSISYYLISNIFPNFKIFCGQIIDQNEMSTSSSAVPIAFEESTLYTESSLLPTSHQLTISSNSSQSITSSYNPNTSPTSSDLPTAIDQLGVWQPPICRNGKIGLDCNISVDPCLMAQPCRNNGTCITTNSSSYICLCPPSQFSGTYCEIDIRPCKSYTCLSRGICTETSPVSFICQCDPGYQGIHCESLINYCNNVTCQNKGVCRPLRLNFTCECTATYFSGRYCEITSSSLVTKQIINRSFAYIAIVALILVAGTIVFMDVLKYRFNIDPVKDQRQRLEREKMIKRSKAQKPKIIRRFIYVNAP